jgi:type IV pilus assembly protein PilW
MMVALVIGLIVLGVIIAVFWNTLQSSNANLRMTRVVQELRAVMDLMIRDLRRAGYWRLAPYATRGDADIEISGGAATIVTDPAFESAFTDWYLGPANVTPVGLSIVGGDGRAVITGYSGGDSVNVNVVDGFLETELPMGAWTLRSHAGNWFHRVDVSANCILYRVDANGDLTVDADERHGFRLSGGAVERYVSGSFSCNNGTWEPLTDPAIVTIDALVFDTTDFKDVDAGGDSELRLRELGMTITGSLTADPFVSRDLHQIVRIRNDLYIPK